MKRMSITAWGLLALGIAANLCGQGCARRSQGQEQKTPRKPAEQYVVADELAAFGRDPDFKQFHEGQLKSGMPVQVLAVRKDAAQVQINQKTGWIGRSSLCTKAELERRTKNGYSPAEFADVGMDKQGNLLMLTGRMQIRDNQMTIAPNTGLLCDKSLLGKKISPSQKEPCDQDHIYLYISENEIVPLPILPHDYQP